ncbi:MAG: DUF373 family protein [Candidatus Marsarchaeota archaeon]|jgi:putative membrane protein|nr:DUF373 family protein [Candidatus Marsarchaeota archaeon]
MTERVLVLAVDIDNDLYRKTRITGPVIGRSANLKAATKLVFADPQDSDGNTMFEAVRKYDELKKMDYAVGIATITGAEKEGYVADAELSRQLDRVLDTFKADSCVLVTDGASDNRVLPILKTRIKVNSVDILRMKQAEEFENTYFTILEKLKEPHYARIVFGIPAILLLLFAISYYLNFGWQLPVAIIGIYLIIKGFGLEDALMSSFQGFGFSVRRASFVLYISSMLFFVISIILGYGYYAHTLATTSNPITLAAAAIEGFLLIFPISLVLYFIGRIMDLENRHMRFRAISQGSYVGYIIIGLALLYTAAAWFIGQLYFWEFLVLSAAAIMLGYLVSYISLVLKKRAISKADLKDKNVINDIGAYIGKITNVDTKSGVMMIKTDYGRVIKFDIDRITSVSDRVIVR